MQDESRFHGWHSRGYLPHCDEPLRDQFITYRLGDALPRDVVAQWSAVASDAEERARVQKYLDAGYGECLLADERAAEIVCENLSYHDQVLYGLRDWVIMPNHAHVSLRPYVALRRIVHAWKSYTSKQITKALGRESKGLWQRGYYDRFIRDARHGANVRCYIYLNPVVAGLVDDPFDWKYSSIHEHDESMKEEIRKWFSKWRKRYYRSV